MRKKVIIEHLVKYIEHMDKQSLQNLLLSWDGKTPKLWCEPNLADCVDCRFPEDRICDFKDCEDRMIFDSKGEL